MPLDSSTSHEQKILLRARALAPVERAAFLQEACGADSELRERIEAKLKAEAIQLPLKESQPAAGPDGTIIVGDALPGTHCPRAEPAPPAGGSTANCHGRFLPGAKVAGRYRIVSLIGQGGMGEVYRADDLKLGHPVALKFLPPDLDEQSPLLQYFLSEVRLSRQIAHPNVCRVYDVGEVEGQHFLSMEYIDGEDLRSLLRRIGRLPADKGVQIGHELCAGLAAAHDKGVLHRDLKPANIMIDGQGRARITDFGLARLTGAKEPGEVAGTPAYMAPEQLARGEATIQSDLFSLGLVLFETFTGKSAFPARSIPELVRAHQELPHLLATLPPEVEPGIERAILNCLEQDPKRRPRSARAVAAAFSGRDALAVALAAGETPSPEIVAAAGGEGTLTKPLGLLCAGLLAAGLVLACVLAQSTYRVNHAKIDKHPEAMAADARRIIEKLGYSAKPLDSAFGYGDYGATGMNFWYRQSPQPLLVFDFYAGFNRMNYAAVEGNVPQLEVPGELSLMLSPRGELLRLQVVPPRFLPEMPLNQSEPDWTRWFPGDLLGFDLSSLEKTAGGVPRPPEPYDRLQVWRGSRGATNLFYVEAASFAGRPVYFDILDPLSFEPSKPSGTLSRGTLATWIYLGLIASAAILAWRNVRLRRSDRHGALRVAFYFLGIGLIISVIQAHHTSGEAETGVFEMALAQAATRAIVFWLWYTALEPYVRRLWPETLISWSRLLEGRWRDPLVGRALLMGCLFGVALNLVHQTNLLSPQWLGLEMRQVQNSPGWTLGTPASLFADVLFKQIDAVFKAMLFLMSLLALRFVLRKKLLASVACVAVFTVLVGPAAAATPWIDWLASALLVGLFFWALVQWGFLAGVAVLLCNNLLTFPLTTDLSLWYASHGLVGAGLVFALGLFGFFTSRGQQPLLRG